MVKRRAEGDTGKDDREDDREGGDGPSDPAPRSVRVDKWLWAARMFKTRSLATDACDGGHVEVNGGGVKPAHAVKVGDRIEALTPGGPKVLAVVGLAEKRGPAEVARALYVDHSPPPPPRELFASVKREPGRVDRRDRRDAQRIRDRW